MNNQLVQIIESNRLEKTKSDVLLENFSGYFEMAAEWERKADELQITDVSQKAEMKLAREGRLFLKEKRIMVEKTRKQLKEASLREGQTIDAIAKVLTNLIIPIEKNLEEKEKFAEIQEAKRIEALRDARTRELEPYIEFVPYGLNLGAMDDENYQKVLSGAKLQKQAKAEADAKAEQERIAREKAEAEARERVRLENERLKKEAEEREKQLAEERTEAEAKRKALEEKARKEREEADRLLQIEREKQAKLETERKAEQARQEAEKLEKERKEAAEKRAKAEAERKAKNAPDKEKLLAFAAQLEKTTHPDLRGDEAQQLLISIDLKLKGTIEYIRTNAEKL